MTSLRGLCLGDTKISDTGLEHLKGLKNLRYRSHGAPNPADYEPIWQSRGALSRVLERRHCDLLASHDRETQG
jgi:hypothetical protein